jgi:putative membrane protein
MGEPRESERPPRPTDTEPARPAEPPPKAGRSRVGGAWVGLVIGAVVLILLLIFVLQNPEDVRVSFLGADSSIPLGVALLLAAVAGALVVAVPGSARILQLRRANRNARRAFTDRS